MSETVKLLGIETKIPNWSYLHKNYDVSKMREGDPYALFDAANDIRTFYHHRKDHDKEMDWACIKCIAHIEILKCRLGLNKRRNANG